MLLFEFKSYFPENVIPTIVSYWDEISKNVISFVRYDISNQVFFADWVEDKLASNQTPYYIKNNIKIRNIKYNKNIISEEKFKKIMALKVMW